MADKNNLETAVVYYRQMMLAKRHLARCSNVHNTALSKLQGAECSEYQARRKQIDKEFAAKPNELDNSPLTSVEMFQQSVRAVESHRASNTGRATINKLVSAKHSKRKRNAAKQG